MVASATIGFVSQVPQPLDQRVGVVRHVAGGEGKLYRPPTVSPSSPRRRLVPPRSKNDVVSCSKIVVRNAQLTRGDSWRRRQRA
jgi:hypothetical protein